MKKTPRIAIILLNYNGIDDTLECLDSLKKCTYNNYQIIIVDNKSNDNSVSILEENKSNYEYILLKATENRGFSAGNNLGIRYALKNGFDYIMLLNNDTVVTPSFLNTLVKHLPDNNVALTGTIYYYYDKNKIWYAGGAINRFTGRTKHFLQNKSSPRLPLSPQNVNYITGCELLVSADVINRVGLLDEDYFLYSEDTDYSLRLENAGVEMLYVPDSVIYHKIGASTKKISKAAQYYSARNRRIMIYRNLKWYQIITALLFTHVQTLHRVIKGRLTIKCVLLGIWDYYKKRYGKTNRNFEKNNL